MHDDRHDAVFTDRDEHQRIVAPAVLHAVRTIFRRVGGFGDARDAGDEHQSAESRKEFAAIDLLRAHALFSRPAAACLIAARIRGYVPQRQMLPVIAVSMSASFGFAFFASSAAAAMICPDWQYPH